MVSLPNLTDDCRSPYNFEHTNLKTVPKSAILLDVLRSLERVLAQRGKISAPNHPSFHPLWFIAETERNVFLWRSGLSLADAPRFEFWIEPQQLIAKRRGHLQSAEADSPFHNLEAGRSAGSESTEATYLDRLGAVLHELLDHAHALSVVGSTVEEELRHNVPIRVVLPLSRKG